ncbi:hypothetical protein ACQRIU_002091 [Beauveria bassiana]
MSNSLWSLARARLKQAYNNNNNNNNNNNTTTCTLNRPKIATKTTTECKALPLHLDSQPPSYEDSIQDRHAFQITFLSIS